jgi:hypothetical protein
MESNLWKGVKNNCLLFLDYFWYLFWFIFKQNRVFLKGFCLKTIQSKIKWADSPGPPVSPPKWLDRTGSARLSRPLHSLSLSVETLTLSPLATRVANASLAQLRWALARSAAALWRFCFGPLRPTSWPLGFVGIASHRRHRLRAPPLWI